MCPVFIYLCAQAVSSLWVVHTPQGWSEEDRGNAPKGSQVPLSIVFSAFYP